MYFEDCRIDKKHARTFLVKKHVGRSSGAMANYLYDNSAYVLGYSDKNESEDRSIKYFNTFKEKVAQISESLPENQDINAIKRFYSQGRDAILAEISQDSLWEDIKKSLSKKYSTFSFRIKGDTKIVAEKRELLQLEQKNEERKCGESLQADMDLWWKLPLLP